MKSITPLPSQSKKLWPAFKKQSIQEAVVQLMCRDGLQAVTMERVAREAGIAKGTIYLHYKDKQELLDSVKNSALTPLFVKLEEVLSSSLPPDKRLHAIIQRYLSYFDERKNLFRILLYERQTTHPQARRYNAGRYRSFLQAVTATIDEAIAAGIFRQIDSGKAATMFIESSIAMMNHRLLTSAQTPVEEDADMVFETFFRGWQNTNSNTSETGNRRK